MSAPPRIGPYEVVRTLGQGGMGTVFEVRHAGFERPLALKLLVPGRIDARRIERFRREGQALARVRHPGVVTVHHFDESPEGSFLVTDLVPGEDLDRVLERGGPFEPRRAAEIGSELARAVEAIHAAGLLHRDLKPANVLLTPEGRPVVVDFGLAWIEGSDALTISGAVMGTPGCMAPEQALGQPADARTDVWGLGTVLLALLGGEMAGMPPLVRPSYPAALDPGLRAVCARALERRPGERYASAAELEADLGRWLEGARPRAHRRLTPAHLGLVAAALALGGLGAVWRLLPVAPQRGGGGASVAGPGSSALEAVRERGAAEALTERLALREPFARRDALAAWLGDHPTHPRAAEARAALARTCWEVPAWRMLESDAGPLQVRGCAWLSDDEVLVVEPSRLARWRLPARGLPDQIEVWERPRGFISATLARGPSGPALLVALEDEGRPPRLELRDASRALDGPVLGHRELEGSLTLLAAAPGAPRAIVCLTLPTGVTLTRFCDLGTPDLAGAVLVADRGARQVAWDARGERVALLIGEARPNTTWTEALEVWAVGPPARQVHIQAQESGGTSALFLAGDPGAVVVGGGNGELVVHSLDGRDPRALVAAEWREDPQALIKVAHRAAVRGLGLAGGRLVSCSEGDQQVLRRWDLTREVEVPPAVATTSHALLGLAVSPDGTRLLLPIAGGLELRTVPE